MLDDVGEYRILVKSKRNKNDKNLVKKYLHIFITENIDDENRTELSFETELPSFKVTIG